MTGGDSLGLISIVVTLILGVLVFFNTRRANRTAEKKADAETELSGVEADDRIAARRLNEIERLDRLVKSLRDDVDKLSQTVRDLQLRDSEKQKTIDEQAGDLKRTNQILADVRSLFSRYTARVEKAWKDGHTMPTLTDDERALLENTIPYRTHKGATP